MEFWPHFGLFICPTQKNLQKFHREKYAEKFSSVTFANICVRLGGGRGVYLFIPPPRKPQQTKISTGKIYWTNLCGHIFSFPEANICVRVGVDGGAFGLPLIIEMSADVIPSLLPHFWPFSGCEYILLLLKTGNKYLIFVIIRNYEPNMILRHIWILQNMKECQVF